MLLMSQFILICVSINLQGNIIDSLGDGIFISHLSKLKSLDLSNNKLTEANFNGLKSLEYLNLSNNNLAKVPDFESLETLIYLDLSGNPIKSVLFFCLFLIY